ncbi:MAG: YceD family protein [Elusimicrobiota bacterium]
MKLSIQDIRDDGVIERRVRLPAEELSLDAPLVKPAEADFRAEAFTEEVMVMGNAAALVRLDCSRCLETYESPIACSFEVHAPFQQEFVDVSEEVRQSLLLAFPVKPLCREECRGICARCGRNLNQEPCGCPPGPSANPFARLNIFPRGSS